MSTQRLFIGHLTDSTTEEDIRALLQPFGVITEIQYVRRYPFNFAHVSFFHRDDRQGSVFELNGKRIDGERIKVEIAHPDHLEVLQKRWNESDRIEARKEEKVREFHQRMKGIFYRAKEKGRCGIPVSALRFYDGNTKVVELPSSTDPAYHKFEHELWHIKGKDPNPDDGVELVGVVSGVKYNRRYLEDFQEETRSSSILSGPRHFDPTSSSGAVVEPQSERMIEDEVDDSLETSTHASLDAGGDSRFNALQKMLDAAADGKPKTEPPQISSKQDDDHKQSKVIGSANLLALFQDPNEETSHTPLRKTARYGAKSILKSSGKTSSKRIEMEYGKTRPAPTRRTRSDTPVKVSISSRPFGGSKFGGNSTEVTTKRKELSKRLKRRASQEYTRKVRRR